MYAFISITKFSVTLNIAKKNKILFFLKDIKIVKLLHTLKTVMNDFKYVYKGIFRRSKS